jgi:hypothetical protein
MGIHGQKGVWIDPREKPLATMSVPPRTVRDVSSPLRAITYRPLAPTQIADSAMTAKINALISVLFSQYGGP